MKFKKNDRVRWRNTRGVVAADLGHAVRVWVLQTWDKDKELVKDDGNIKKSEVVDDQ